MCWANTIYWFVYTLLSAGVEDQQHYEAYESALKGGLPLTMQYLKFLFFGPPRTGKSTARRRLVQEIDNLNSLGKPSASTGVAEANDVIIKKLTSEPAAISGSQWWSMKKSKDDGRIDEGDCDYLAQLFYRLISKTMSETEQTTTVPATISEPALSISESESEESDIAESTDIKEASSPPKSPKLQDHTEQDLLTEFRAELSSVPLSNSEEKEIDEAFKKLTSTLQSGSPEELRKLLEDLTMLNMVDIGGQSAFLELCPAFTTGPALYFIFFRLDQELKKNYQIKYQSADGEETILESSYCTETVVHQTLSSIACFERQSTAESTSSSIVSGHAILIGTYKDKVNDERISQMNTILRQQLEHTKLYKEDLLLQASEDVLFYSLNNMTGDDSEMSPIREDIEKIIKNMFSKVDIPASWLMFRILLHFLHKPVVSVTECEEIAKRLSMTTPVREAIWFFHHNVGSLMHYPDIPSMKDMVICDSQVVFDSTSELIIDTFKVSNRDIPQSAVKDFREKGQFSLEHIKDRTESHRKNQLSLKQLVDLLKSHNILAEIKSDQESSEQLQPIQVSSAQSNQYQPKFIMPAVLKEASEEELKLENSKQEAAPLMIHFEGGFVPFGVFCASVANLIARRDSLSPRWQLCNSQVMKNKVKFSIDKSFYATLISRPQYFEIRVERHPRGRSRRSLSNICSTVRQTVVQTLETVITKMRYNVHAKMETTMFTTAHTFNVAFICCMEKSHSDHLIKVDKDDNGYFGECPKDPIGLDLEEKHLIWFNQVRLFLDDFCMEASILYCCVFIIITCMQDNCSSNVVQLDASSNSSVSGFHIKACLLCHS